MMKETSFDVPHPRASWLDPATGEALLQADLMHELSQQQAVMIGESHDIAEIHRWQLSVCTYLHLLQPNLAIGFEMFPRRLQPVLDNWVDGILDTASFIDQSEWHKVWGFDPAIYLPIFHFCRQQRIPMLALNCRRSLVTEVGKLGWDAIAEADRDGLSPAASATDSYRHYLYSLVGTSSRIEATSGTDAKFDRFVRAQQTWDRAFACNITHALEADPTRLIIGIIGRGHLEYGYGTPSQLQSLGISKQAVLLPNTESRLTIVPKHPIGRAVFRLDTPEPPAQRVKNDSSATAAA
ncbi:ChaN family lipoprotein [Paenalcaligenes niemegkensis]|uniref:ChaN family lipoprotein n=1 Tax=Paenalcaligenes niemegkensis TaxID=2895469 RepID=UPI001EE976F2|nr:ChaN family lipoprotein [Paenalcaligenes niemegkensis]MCQ9617515.1 ChaN family lipoprotein [Paenalcaligenes niemegkensis]